MTHSARRIGRTLALVLPVVLVLSGTLAVTSVPWAGQTSETQLLTASAQNVSVRAKPRAPQEVLRGKLLTEMQKQNPGTVLTHLQREVEASPSLAKHCMSIARSLGRAAVDRFGPTRAQSYSKPVCDTSFAAGVAQQSQGS
ncbi:hypothetical protein [Streptomyces sp. CAU 1734]|uniref:hypothetical protein n=1 Tax=Streptomyces sp. CAU 1734 TaxID=3140360 RepID=UPI003260F5B4